MSKQNLKLVFAIIVILSALLAGYFLLQPTSSSKVDEPKKVTIPEATTPDLKPKKYFYPISDYEKRLSYRPFGKYVTAEDKAPDCGRTFVGFHNADDLEVTVEEKIKDVEVRAIANGEIKLVDYIDGYGGLIVFAAEIEGQQYLFNYGHVRLSSVSLKVNDAVQAGQVIGVLGNGCSEETDGERKHLHFAVHKDSSTDIRGYIDSQEELNSDWLNPNEFLKKIAANY